MATQYYYGTPIFHWSFQQNGITPNGTRTRLYQIILDTPTLQNQIVLSSSSSGIRLDFLEPDGGQPPCPPDCIFTVTKNGAIVYQETRSVCPEVQKLSCRISDEVKSIKFEKLPYLERAEVVDYFYDVRQGGLIDSDNYGLFLSKGKIPDECLNIYRNDITSIIPNDFGSITNTPENGFNLVAQICSAPSCPPPKYGVVCNDECFECTECPPGTHPLICDDIVCCYGDDGKVVLEIPKSDYCGGESCCE